MSKVMSKRPLKLGQAGFTLLETMIAMAIMMIAFSAILMVESASINTSAKAKQMNVVAMLAKNKMIESEFDYEGKTFDEYKKEDSGSFPDPNQDYSWKREVKEVTFPDISGGGGKDDSSSNSSASSGAQASSAEQAAMFTKLLTQFLSKAVREVTVTISWKRGQGSQSYSVSTYWVNLNNEFQLSQ